MKVITQKDIQEINKLYSELHTYAAVARKTGFSPATVKKYVIKDYVPINEAEVVRFDRPLPEFDPVPFRAEDWGALCVLSNVEIDEIKELWKEIEV